MNHFQKKPQSSYISSKQFVVSDVHSHIQYAIYPNQIHQMNVSQLSLCLDSRLHGGGEPCWSMHLHNGIWPRLTPGHHTSNWRTRVKQLPLLCPREEKRNPEYWRKVLLCHSVPPIFNSCFPLRLFLHFGTRGRDNNLSRCLLQPLCKSISKLLKDLLDNLFHYDLQSSQ